MKFSNAVDIILIFVIPRRIFVQKILVVYNDWLKRLIFLFGNFGKQVPENTIAQRKT